MDSLNLWDINDRELLYVIEDEKLGSGDFTGWTSTADIAERFAIPRNSVGSRMAWMVRYGVVQKHSDKAGFYRLTRIGQSLKDGKLSEAQEGAIKDAEPEQVLMLMRVFTQRYRRVGVSARNLTRREWIVGTQKRPRGR